MGSEFCNYLKSQKNVVINTYAGTAVFLLRQMHQRENLFEPFLPGMFRKRPPITGGADTICLLRMFQ
jgi:hypothetical protein